MVRSNLPTSYVDHQQGSINASTGVILSSTPTAVEDGTEQDKSESSLSTQSALRCSKVSLSLNPNIAWILFLCLLQGGYDSDDFM